VLRVFKLPLRAGLGVGLIAAVVVGVASVFTAAVPGWIVAAMSLLMGAAGYLVVRLLVSTRIGELERSLKAIDRGSSGEGVFHPAGGDELERLGQLVKGTSASVTKEMDRLKMMETYRRDFIGNVSHELATPIFAIKGFSETLLGGALEDQSVNRSFVEKILRNAGRLENLARDLSEISRIETGELAMSIAPFPLHEVIAEVIELLEPRAAEKNVTLRSLLAVVLPPALGDEERIRQVFTNLVDNAIKYRNDGGTVEVVARFVAPASLKVSVVDAGIGVGQDHHILGAHGKRLQIQSAEGKGSTFGFSIDAAVAAKTLMRSESVSLPS
jgi:two-component system phosphate regulon sensor histidine kinase PhoR